jgi:hypothetical protein
MFQMPMSSDMMTRIFGFFCSCCAILPPDPWR